MNLAEHHLHVLMVLGFLGICVLWLHFVIKKEDNDLNWEDLVSVHGADGKSHADWTKIGQGAGVFVAVFVPILYALSPTFDPASGAALMGASLLYLGGVAGYSATLRSHRDNDHA